VRSTQRSLPVLESSVCQTPSPPVTIEDRDHARHERAQKADVLLRDRDVEHFAEQERRDVAETKMSAETALSLFRYERKR